VKKRLLFGVSVPLLFVVLSALSQTEEPPAPNLPPARPVPGITVEDPYPNGCVDCHIDYTDMKMDTRFSTMMKQWQEGVPPKLLAKAQAAASDGVTLKGEHPAVPKSAFENIPAGCRKCHGEDSEKAPPAARMTHLIHLTGGDENHFMTVFQGQCTYCHKLNQATGEWTIPSAPEK
jgi:hypothetical protein